MARLSAQCLRAAMSRCVIAQAIASVLLHARNSMPTGGRVHIATENSAFERYGRQGDVTHYVRLTIADTGAGMHQEEADRLFEPLHDLDGSNNGLGLRLFI